MYYTTLRQTSPTCYLAEQAQVIDAMAFLKEHEVAIRDLQMRPGVEMCLDFPVDLRIDREKVFWQCEVFPPAFDAAAESGLPREVWQDGHKVG